MRILVIDGHPDAGSYCDALARSYVEGAQSGGHDVRCLRLREMQFDPIRHGGFTAPQPLEPALVEAREAIRCKNVTVVTYDELLTRLKNYIQVLEEFSGKGNRGGRKEPSGKGRRGKLGSSLN